MREGEVRSYAGGADAAVERLGSGTLGIIDDQARPGLGDDERQPLAMLAAHGAAVEVRRELRAPGRRRRPTRLPPFGSIRQSASSTAR